MKRVKGIAARHPGSCSSLVSVILTLSLWAEGLLHYYSQKPLRVVLAHFLSFQRDLPQLAEGSFSKTTTPIRLSRIVLGPEETMRPIFCVPTGEGW